LIKKQYTTESIERIIEDEPKILVNRT
jgi:hypothetical protein